MFRQDHELASNMRFELDTGSWDALWMDVDPDRIRQVLWNLLRNACQAQQLKGCVTLRVEPPSDKDESEWMDILIDDEGPGLAPQALEKLFEPFFTTKPDGTGLGLATSHRIVSEHGGQLMAENLATGGARFTLRLPFRARAGIKVPAIDSGDFSVQQRRPFVTSKDVP
jgi:signal transduction histidine kinase